MINKNFFELLNLLKYSIKFQLLVWIHRGKINYKKFPLIWGPILIRGINGKIIFNGRENSIKIRGNLLIIFDDKQEEGILEIGESTEIDYNVIISPRGGKICIGRNTFIGPFSIIQSFKKTKILIGNNVLIGKGVSIFASDHLISYPTNGYKEEYGSNIIIEDNVWIGSNVVITQGVTIGENSVIGAGAVVTKNIPPYSLAVGIPAKIVKIFDFKSNLWKKID